MELHVYKEDIANIERGALLSRRRYSLEAGWNLRDSQPMFYNAL